MNHLYPSYTTVKTAERALNDMITVRNGLEAKGKDVTDLDVKIKAFKELIESWHILYSNESELRRINLDLNSQMSTCRFELKETALSLKKLKYLTEKNLIFNEQQEQS